jgi:outer membrane protein OmpA-like peptidoglycan-associated protein
MGMSGSTRALATSGRPGPLPAPALSPARGRVLRRTCACGGAGTDGECEECRAAAPAVRRFAAGAGGPGLVPPIVHEVLRSPGRPLDPATLAFMEPRFGHDFGRVRVHADARAAESARAVGALAYAVGGDIVFGTGQFAPATAEGKRLLAHELAHVVQQPGAPAPGAATEVGPADDEYERAAEAAAHAAVGGAARPLPAAGPAPAAGPRIRRQSDPAAPPGAPTEDVGTPAGSPVGAPAGAPECPPVPTGLVEVDPAPPCPTPTHADTTEVARFHFCLDSDQLVPTERFQVLTEVVDDNPVSTRFLVHGYASTEGRADYNFRLACHRANAVGRALGKVLRDRITKRLIGKPDLGQRVASELASRLEVAAAGPTGQFAADPEGNRVVLVYAQTPGGAEPDEPTCADAPRHLGDVKPEVPCDPPTLDLTGMEGGPQLTHFHFCLDSDVLAAVGPSAVAAFAQRQASGATFVVHGFASTEGPADYNRRLSCHRAMRIARELTNAGVRPEQVREVSGLGATDQFASGPEFNRVVVVLAEGGEIAPIAESPMPADTIPQKRAIVDAALARLSAGQYALAADAYISFWTCGRTPTVRQAAERLTVLVPEDQDETEEGIGVNTVRLSNTALRADNPVECTMGRLIDMAFHHAVIGDPDLSPDLADRSKPAARHAAGLHLIALAGLSACQGQHARARVLRGKVLAGIDEPLADDPREDLPPPACAEAPQPTRRLPPAAGEKDRQAPAFGHSYEPPVLNSGALAGRAQLGAEARGAWSLPTGSDVIRASAEVSLLGRPEVFADYEVGFIQTILEDLTLAEYDSGRVVVQELPVPIRAGAITGGVPAPAPWTAPGATAVPDANGRASVRAGWRLDTDFALTFNYFRPDDLARTDLLDTWHRHTTVAIWLIARRRGAPLDRFSVVFLDGSVYEVTQDLNVDIRRKLGELDRPEEDPEGKGEKELYQFVGDFQASETSAGPTDERAAQLGGPAAGEIDLNRQVSRFLEPPAAPEAGGMSLDEYRQVAAQILDNLKLFPSEEAAAQGTGGTVMPRLGFVFGWLEVHVLIDRGSGRMLPYLGKEGEDPVRVESAGMGEWARLHLSKALALRLAKRDFLGQGRPVVLLRDVARRLPGTPEVGEAIFVLPPLQAEPDLLGDKKYSSMVLADMAGMWDCTEITISDRDAREFGMSYWLDRNGDLHRSPPDRFSKSDREDDEGWKTRLDCGPEFHPVGVSIGTVHTHTWDDPHPSPGDWNLAGVALCGKKHYIVSKSTVQTYSSDGSTAPVGDREALLPPGVRCTKQNFE